MMNINKKYKFFVVCTDSDLIVGGYEHQDDAIDLMDELNEECVLNQFKVYTTGSVFRIFNMNPYLNNNWTNPTFN